MSSDEYEVWFEAPHSEYKGVPYSVFTDPPWTLSNFIYRLDRYQEAATEMDLFLGKPMALQYHALALAGEVGELANKVKKQWRSGVTEPKDKDFIVGMSGELGDILWYVSAIAETLGLRLSDIANMNIAKLRSRRLRGKLDSGDGDTR